MLQTNSRSDLGSWSMVLFWPEGGHAAASETILWAIFVRVFFLCGCCVSDDSCEFAYRFPVKMRAVDGKLKLRCGAD